MLSRMGFNAQMEQLADAFGESKKDKFDKKMEVYFDLLSPRLSDNQLEQVVQFLLRNHEKFPTIKTILETSKNFQEPPVVGEKFGCAVCDGMGTLKATDKDGYKFLFKCPECQNCRGIYPTWDSTKYSRGYKVNFKGTGWNPNDKQQNSGLAMMGKNSIVWQKSPH